MRALANLSRSTIPNPPFVFGKHVVVQLISECPPLTFSGLSPLHRKLLLMWSIFFISHFCAWNTIRWYIGKLDITVLTNVSFPEDDRNFPFHSGSLAPILSIKGWTSILLSFLVCEGCPRYFPGKVLILPGFNHISLHPDRKSFGFGHVHLQSWALPENSRFSCNLANSIGDGLVNRAASSAYREHHSFACFGWTGCNSPCWAACSIIRWRGSIAIMKSNGDRGSPCLSPLHAWCFDSAFHW